MHPRENANAVAVEHIKWIVRRELHPPDVAPLFVFHAGYDTVQLSQGIERTQASRLVRLRSDRCFYIDPVPVQPSAESAVAVVAGSRPTAGPGWYSPLPLNSGWLAAWGRIADCRGNHSWKRDA